LTKWIWKVSLYTHHSWYTFHTQVYSLQHIFSFYFNCSSAIIIQLSSNSVSNLAASYPDWLSGGFTSHLTQNRSFWRRFPRFSRLLWHPTWKRRGPILVSALDKCVTYLLAYLLRHLPTYLRPWYPHGALISWININLWTK